jgi:hypothetical protein
LPAGAYSVARADGTACLRGRSANTSPRTSDGRPVVAFIEDARNDGDEALCQREWVEGNTPINPDALSARSPSAIDVGDAYATVPLR